jgi:hypothetical protein
MERSIKCTRCGREAAGHVKVSSEKLFRKNAMCADCIGAIIKQCDRKFRVPEIGSVIMMAGGVRVTVIDVSIRDNIITVEDEDHMFSTGIGTEWEYAQELPTVGSEIWVRNRETGMISAGRVVNVGTISDFFEVENIEGMRVYDTEHEMWGGI